MSCTVFVKIKISVFTLDKSVQKCKWIISKVEFYAQNLKIIHIIPHFKMKFCQEPQNFKAGRLSMF